MSQPITVAQLNRYVNALLEKDGHLNPVLVKGELSGFRAYPSGHLYFTLKDEKSAVSCVMFKGQTSKLRFKPADGNKVIVTARAGLYDRDGRFQLYINDMVSDGLGDLHLAFEQLKEDLAKQGLFDEDHKKKLPVLPRAIGVVTSSSGAVIRDIIQVLSRRYPNFRLQLVPVPVQGEGAAVKIAAAIDLLNKRDEVDVLIVGRGGGSLEDLWAFNEAVVAHAVYRSKIPVVSAVGHETDFTICDFTADMRAPTPSAAAELVMPVKHEAAAFLRAQEDRLEKALRQRLLWQRQHLDHLQNNQVFRRPLQRIDRCRLDLDHTLANLNQKTWLNLQRHERQLSLLCGKLDALSPLKILARGYGLVRSVPDGRTVLSTALINPGDEVDIWLSDGVLNCQVNQVTDRRKINE